MRTGRALTVSGGGVHPRRIFLGEKKLKRKKKEKKIWDPPKNFRAPPPKISDTPRNRPTPPPPPPRWTEFLTHASENITLAQLRCGR